MFVFRDETALGKVVSVDTGTVVVQVHAPDRLQRLQVNRLVVLQARPGQPLIGVVRKITRQMEGEGPDEETLPGLTLSESNFVRIALVGTLFHRDRGQRHVFRRSLEAVPQIDALCFALEGPDLTAFMQIVSQIGASDAGALSLGSYTLDAGAAALLNGNRFFQRHAVVVGSTGSGKSWTTARLLEQVADLPNANALVFDIHGEYRTLTGPGFRHFRVAGPADLEEGTASPDVLYLPYWLLNYEALRTLLVERSDQNAPNQTMLIGRLVREAKEKFLTDAGRGDLLAGFTVDSPIPFDLDWVLKRLNDHNEAMEINPNTGKERQAEFNNKLGRLIARLEAKTQDRRHGFLFGGHPETIDLDYLNTLVERLLAGRQGQPEQQGGVKIIDFSEVPSDILPLIIAMVAGLVFSVQQWTASEQRHPIALFCDEAHNYIPDVAQDDSEARVAVRTFERLAKEGRKYGVGLVIISQRPAEVSRTVISQCNNVIAMRLTNAEDQSRVRSLLPDTLAGFADLLPVLDVGEAVVVGDASLLPARVRIAEPRSKPDSRTIEFWTRWSTADADDTQAVLCGACEAWRRQSLQVAPSPAMEKA